ncbi:GNAT family N-acetyltransferase [soil metagenome]
MLIREAVESDLPGILYIHNEAIRTTTAIWDEDEVGLEERHAWWLERGRIGCPILVCEIDGVVAGYASYGPYRPKSGYRFTVENSAYVRADHHGRGVAKALMPVLIARAREAGLHRILAGIESGNQVSKALHARFGFRSVAEMPEVGIKFGRWLDLTYMQLDL